MAPTYIPPPDNPPAFYSQVQYDSNWPAVSSSAWTCTSYCESPALSRAEETRRWLAYLALLPRRGGRARVAHRCPVCDAAQVQGVRLIPGRTESRQAPASGTREHRRAVRQLLAA